MQQLDALDKKIIYFFFACIPLRFLYAYVQNNPKVFFIPTSLHTPLRWVSMVIGIAFIYQWLKWYPTQRGFFKGRVWWNPMRLIHGLIFMYATVCPRVLYADVGLGVVAMVYHLLFQS